MNSVLVKLFVKNYNELGNQKTREAYGKLAGVVGIISNISLFILKITLGLLFSSVSIIADALNNLTDSVASVITLVGFKLSSKPADKEHPFGHARIEYISGIIVSFIIVLLGFELLQTSFEKIMHPETPTITPIVILGLALSCAVKVWQSLFYKKIAQKIKSKTLLATSADSRNDFLTTFFVLISSILIFFTQINIDAYLGAGLSIFIMVSGIKLVIETSTPLLGEAPEEALVSTIKEKVLSYNGVLGVHDLLVHTYGAGKIFASMHCEFDINLGTGASHDLLDNIERDFSDELGISLVLHGDPLSPYDEKTQDLHDLILRKTHEIFPNSNIHDFRVIWGIDHSNLVFDVSIPFSIKKSDDEIEKELSLMISDIDTRYRTKIIIDRLTF